MHGVGVHKRCQGAAHSGGYTVYDIVPRCYASRIHARQSTRKAGGEAHPAGAGGCPPGPGRSGGWKKFLGASVGYPCGCCAAPYAATMGAPPKGGRWLGGRGTGFLAFGFCFWIPSVGHSGGCCVAPYAATIGAQPCRREEARKRRVAMHPRQAGKTKTET